MTVLAANGPFATIPANGPFATIPANGPFATIPANGPFDADAAFGYLARHAIPGVDLIDPAARRLTRVIPRSGTTEPVTVGLHPDGVDLFVSGLRPDLDPQLIALVRSWFDLDAELTAIDEVLDRDPLLAAAGESFPGIRIVGFPDDFEAAITTVLGQQVSLAAVRTLAGRLAAGYGTPSPCGLTMFPTPDRLAGVPVDDLRAAVGVTGARVRTLHAVAALFADGFSLGAPVSNADVRETLLAVPGIGPWTVEYLAMRVLHDADACPAADLVLRRALGVERAADVLIRAESWRPYRAYAVMRLWTSALAAADRRRSGR